MSIFRWSNLTWNPLTTHGCLIHFSIVQQSLYELVLRLSTPLSCLHCFHSVPVVVWRTFLWLLGVHLRNCLSDLGGGPIYKSHPPILQIDIQEHNNNLLTKFFWLFSNILCPLAVISATTRNTFKLIFIAINQPHPLFSRASAKEGRLSFISSKYSALISVDSFTQLCNSFKSVSPLLDYMKQNR